MSRYALQTSSTWIVLSNRRNHSELLRPEPFPRHARGWLLSLGFQTQRHEEACLSAQDTDTKPLTRPVCHPPTRADCAVMDGPEFTQRWRVREAKGQLSPSRRGFRQKIIGMSANGEAPEIQVDGGVHRCFCLFDSLILIFIFFVSSGGWGKIKL